MTATDVTVSEMLRRIGTYTQLDERGSYCARVLYDVEDRALLFAAAVSFVAVAQTRKDRGTPLRAAAFLLRDEAADRHLGATFAEALAALDGHLDRREDLFVLGTELFVAGMNRAREAREARRV